VYTMVDTMSRDYLSPNDRMLIPGLRAVDLHFHALYLLVMQPLQNYFYKMEPTPTLEIRMRYCHSTKLYIFKMSISVCCLSSTVLKLMREIKTGQHHSTALHIMGMPICACY